MLTENTQDNISRAILDAREALKEMQDANDAGDIDGIFIGASKARQAVREAADMAANEGG